MRWILIALVAAAGCEYKAPGKVESPTQYAVALKADNVNLPDGWRLRISKRGNPAYPDYIDEEEKCDTY